jgi:uncharacterized Zn finger protein
LPADSASIPPQPILCRHCGNTLGYHERTLQHIKHRGRELVCVAIGIKCERCGAIWSNVTLPEEGALLETMVSILAPALPEAIAKASDETEA